MTTHEILEELKEIVDSGDRSQKTRILELCGQLKSGGHDKHFIESDQTRRRWETHISNVETYAKHPNYKMKATGAISMMRSDLPESR